MTFLIEYMDGLMQDFSNSSAVAMELLQSCAKPSIFNNRSQQWSTVGDFGLNSGNLSWYIILMDKNFILSN